MTPASAPPQDHADPPVLAATVTLTVEDVRALLALLLYVPDAVLRQARPRRTAATCRHRYGKAAMNFVTLSPDRRPIPAVSADDPLVRATTAYTARMRAEATRLRDLADLYDALADNSEPVPVVVSG